MDFREEMLTVKILCSKDDRLKVVNIHLLAHIRNTAIVRKMKIVKEVTLKTNKQENLTRQETSKNTEYKTINK